MVLYEKPVFQSLICSAKEPQSLERIAEHQGESDCDIKVAKLPKIRYFDLINILFASRAVSLIHTKR